MEYVEAYEPRAGFLHPHDRFGTWWHGIEGARELDCVCW
jgi:hypothetical protein